MVPVFTDEFHDTGHDFSSIGLRGLDPDKFGWGDWGIPPENEKEGFRFMQKALIDYYAWFRRAIRMVSGCAHHNK